MELNTEIIKFINKKKINNMEFTIEDFKNLNSGNENLGEYDYSNWKGGSLPPFIFDEKKVKSNFEIFQEFQTARHILS